MQSNQDAKVERCTKKLVELLEKYETVARDHPQHARISRRARDDLEKLLSSTPSRTEKYFRYAQYALLSTLLLFNPRVSQKTVQYTNQSYVEKKLPPMKHSSQIESKKDNEKNNKENKYVERNNEKTPILMYHRIAEPFVLDLFF